MGLIKKIGVVFLAFIVIGILFGGDSNTQTNPTENVALEPTTIEKQIVSTSFEDFEDVYCDEDTTALQKKILFDKKFKDKYVTWTGEVTSIGGSEGSYHLRIKHCYDTWTNDIVIKMREDQENNLLKLKEGDDVTYTAKMTSIGGILDGISAKDGIISASKVCDYSVSGFAGTQVSVKDFKLTDTGVMTLNLRNAAGEILRITKINVGTNLIKKTSTWTVETMGSELTGNGGPTGTAGDCYSETIIISYTETDDVVHTASGKIKGTFK